MMKTYGDFSQSSRGYITVRREDNQDDIKGYFEVHSDDE